MRIDYAARAQALVGTRFRAQGRGEGGLDCVGVILLSFDLPPDSVRRDYRLRGDHLRAIRNELDVHFRQVSKTQMRPGDVMVLAPAERQLHLAVRTTRGFVHAHAGIRRVVQTPGEPTWPILAAYRRRRRSR